MFLARSYRDAKSPRLTSTHIAYRQADIELRWRLATDEKADLKQALEREAPQLLKQLYQTVHFYGLAQPLFLTSLEPLSLPAGNLEETVKEMYISAQIANTGPMAAVAGAIAQSLGKALMARFPLEELVVENGGDIYYVTQAPLYVGLYAGLSSLSEKLAIELAPGRGGLAASSGRVGPSLSFGQADLALIIHKNAAIADALATALGNRIKTNADLERAVADFAPENKAYNCLGALAIKGEKLAALGAISLRPLA